MNGWTWVRIGAISGAVAVGAGAFGAHGLKEKLTERALAAFETGVRYQMYHALAIVGVGVLLILRPSAGAAAKAAAWGFLAGTILFSGGLYAWALSGIRALVWLPPIGGIAFIVGWVALALAAGGTTPTPATRIEPQAQAVQPARERLAAALADKPSTGAEGP
jgi:uncharacterized membrane protein YgdD (TMEM256/DUF423 family)